MDFAERRYMELEISSSFAFNFTGHVFSQLHTEKTGTSLITYGALSRIELELSELFQTMQVFFIHS
jgi:hypothetical protein